MLAVHEYVSEMLQHRPLTIVLAAVGALWAASQVVRLSSFCYFYFLRRSQLDRYKSVGGKASWALVTGASDGKCSLSAPTPPVHMLNPLLNRHWQRLCRRVVCSRVQRRPARS